MLLWRSLKKPFCCFSCSFYFSLTETQMRQGSPRSCQSLKHLWPLTLDPCHIWQETQQLLCPLSLNILHCPLFNKDALNWSEVTLKTFIMFQINAALLNFLFICESWTLKSITVSIRKLFSTLDNNQKWYDFWRSCDAEDWRNQLLCIRNKWDFPVFT